MATNRFFACSTLTLCLDSKPGFLCLCVNFPSLSRNKDDVAAAAGLEDYVIYFAAVARQDALSTKSEQIRLLFLPGKTRN